MCEKVVGYSWYLISASSKLQPLHKDSCGQPGLGTSLPLTYVLLGHFTGLMWH